MRINALEDQETGFNGDVDDNDEVAAYSFIFVRENYTAFNEETQKIYWRFYYENKTWFNFCMDEKWSVD